MGGGAFALDVGAVVALALGDDFGLAIALALAAGRLSLSCCAQDGSSVNSGGGRHSVNPGGGRNARAD